MSRTIWARTACRLAAVTAGVLAGVVATAGMALAHVEVEAEGARALAQNVAVTFTAESESPSDGITKLEVILPEGIKPGDITLKEGPKGWKVAATQRGYAVSGPAVAAGEDVEYAVTIRQLPDAKKLAFKTLQTYSDGRVDRWIELAESGGSGGHGHGNEAPVLELQPAEPGAKQVSPTPTVASASAAPSSASPSAAPSRATGGLVRSEDDGASAAWPVGIGAALLVLIVGGGAWWLRRRRAGSA